MMIDKTKDRTTISINSSVLAEARDKGLNVSGITEDALKEILMSFEIATDPSNCKHRWTWPFATSFGLAKECLKCRTIERVKIESAEETQNKYNSIL